MTDSQDFRKSARWIDRPSEGIEPERAGAKHLLLREERHVMSVVEVL